MWADIVIHCGSMCSWLTHNTAGPSVLNTPARIAQVVHRSGMDPLVRSRILRSYEGRDDPGLALIPAGSGGHFNFFLGGQKFFVFFNATGLLKNWRKQHFICSNFTLFWVPFFLSFFLLFFSFSFFLFFFFFFFLGGGGGGATAPSPLKWRPWPGWFLCERKGASYYNFEIGSRKLKSWLRRLAWSNY